MDIVGGLCRLLILAAITVISQAQRRVVPVRKSDITRKHAQVSANTYRYFEEELQRQREKMERRIQRLDARIIYLETGVRLPDIPEEEEFEPEEIPFPGGRGGLESATVPEEEDPAGASNYAPTCGHIYDSGYTHSGDYTIDPDGRGNRRPFTVYCDMDSGEGVTVVGHNSEDLNIKVNGFENPGSFALRPVYQNSATLQQLGSLADASSECRQWVRYACRFSGLMEVHKASKLTYAWWVDRYGQRRVNWGGAETDSGMCACGASSNCFQAMPTCNCDSPNAKNQADEGYLTDKDLLPVMGINLGDTGGKKERGAITLGKLICRG